MNEGKIWVQANKDPFKFNGVQFSKKPTQVKNELWVRSLLNERRSPSIIRVAEPKENIKKGDKKTKGGK